MTQRPVGNSCTFSPFYELNEAGIIKLKELTQFLSPPLRVIRELSAKALYNLAQLAPEYSAAHGRCALAVLPHRSRSHTHAHACARPGPLLVSGSGGAGNNVFLSCEKCKNWCALTGTKPRPVATASPGSDAVTAVHVCPQGSGHSRELTGHVMCHPREVGFLKK